MVGEKAVEGMTPPAVAGGSLNSEDKKVCNLRHKKPSEGEAV